MEHPLKSHTYNDRKKVVTHNNLITADCFASLTLEEKKICYYAFAQCRMDDISFFTEKIDLNELAAIINTTPKSLKRKAKKIEKTLFEHSIRIKKKYKLFEIFSFENNQFVFKLHSDMRPLLLKLKSNFSQPDLSNFLKFKHSYTIAIWHLLQREMKSEFPRIDAPTIVKLSVDELRLVTGKQELDTQISHFRTRVLLPAIKDIQDNLYIKIDFVPYPSLRKISSYKFTISNCVQLNPSDALIEHVNKHKRCIELNFKKQNKKITPSEQEELNLIKLVSLSHLHL